MPSSSKIAVGVLAFTLGCAGETVQKSNVPAAVPAAQQCPKIDVQRMSEISDIDKENQQQITKVGELEQRLSALQARLSTAVHGNNDGSSKEGVSVASTGNRVRVRLSDELLFRPASARISEAGRKALDQIVTVLKDTASKRIEIAGHTDNLPMSIKKYEDNWELSVERARRVGSYLLTQGLDPKKLMMSGYADTEPVDPANTAEARAKNRRVEILIEPTDSASH